MVKPIKEEKELYLNLDAGELYVPPDMSRIRKCLLLDNIRGPRPQGYWLVKVKPAIPGNFLGSDKDITELILAERWQGDNLSKMGNRHVPVYVCIILNPSIIEKKSLKAEDIKMVGWAEVAKRPELFSTQEKQNP